MAGKLDKVLLPFEQVLYRESGSDSSWSSHFVQGFFMAMFGPGAIVASLTSDRWEEGE